MATKEDLNRLIDKPLPEIRLGTAATPSTIRTKTGLERKTAGKVEGEEVTAQSTDGLFTFVVTVVKV